MGAPKGNKFWELRSKHGRDKLFATPELMWEAAKEYFEYCIETPWVKYEQSKTPIKPMLDDLTGEMIWPSQLVEIPTARPFTLMGLCLYLDCNTQYFAEFKRNLTPNDKDFSVVIARIEDIIRNQKFEGASVGVFNANIIARDLGLMDNVNNNVTFNTEVNVKDEQTKANLNKLINGHD